MKIHIITQYAWPDGSPVCLISESIAAELHADGHNVCVVSGKGSYRESNRPKPEFEIINLDTFDKKRDTFFDILKGYYQVTKAQIEYIRKNIKSGDLVVVTSAPFSSLFFRYFIPRKTKKIYWLFDYFPASLKCLYNVPNFVKSFFDLIWRYELSKWDEVIKISENLGYFGKNVHTFRQWPMIDIHPDGSVPDKAALYTGNLGIAHDEKALIAECERLRNEGYEINIYADGPKTKKLPAWMASKGVFKDAEELKKALIKHEIHLIAGTPNTDELSFPSKIWNSIASGRTIVACGMIGKMNKELQDSLNADYKKHKEDLKNFISINVTKS